MMPNNDPRDRFVHPCLTLMVDSFSCILFVPRLEFIIDFSLTTPLLHVSHFVQTSFSDALVTFVLATKHYNRCDTQGQNNMVRHSGSEP